MRDMPIKPPFFNQADWVWLNGHLIPWNEASTNIFSHGLHYGSGVFEGIRAYKTAKGPGVFRLQDHLDRLFESASAYGMELPYSRERLTEAIFCLLDVNSLDGNSYVRPLCWYGVHDLGFTSGRWPVQVAIIAWPWGNIFGEEQSRNGIRVGVSSWRRIHSSMLPTTAKGCGQYLNSILAAQDAVRRGFDEALLLDMSGNIAEGPGENIFLINQNKLLTNDRDSSILMGITRDSVIRIARDLGITVEVRPLTLNDLFSAQEAFFCGTAVEIVTIREVDGVLIGDAVAKPVTRQIRHAFDAITRGRNEVYEHWVELPPVAKINDSLDATLAGV